jgi:uncharacterized protein with FMN-binding domain
MMTLKSRPLQISFALGSLAVLGGCQAGNVAVSIGDDALEDVASPETTEITEDVTTPADSPDAPSAALGPFNDGTYEVTGGYQSPNGPETVVVSLSVVDGVVTQATVTPQATNSTSTRYQGQFAGGIAEEVVGVPLAELDVTRVAGSSLTGRGFNEALEQIRAQAHSG